MTRKMGVAGAAVIAMLSIVLSYDTARAYCPDDGDTCPATGAVFEICGSADCTTAYSVTGADIIWFGKRASNGRLAACISVSGSWSLRRLRLVGTTSEITNTSMPSDMKFCAGAGADYTGVQAYTATCVAANDFQAWNYNSYRLEQWGQGGADLLHGGAGADRLCGGTGDDGSSGDLMSGANGDDDVDGWTGNDYLNGGGGTDDVWGYDGADYVLDDSGSNDNLYGENGNDPCVYDYLGAFTELNCHTAGSASDPTYTSDVTGNSSGTVNCNSVNSSCWAWCSDGVCRPAPELTQESRVSLRCPRT